MNPRQELHEKLIGQLLRRVPGAKTRMFHRNLLTINNEHWDEA